MVVEGGAGGGKAGDSENTSEVGRRQVSREGKWRRTRAQSRGSRGGKEWQVPSARWRGRERSQR